MICNNNQIDNRSLIVIIVLYYPNVAHLNNLIEILQKSSKNVVFIDNTPKNINENLKEKIKKENSNIHYIALDENKGIAEAQNIGIKYAQKIKTIEFLLFLDQDSLITDTFVSQMLFEYKRISNFGVKISALGPIIVNKHSNKEYKRECFGFNNGRDYYQPSMLISSGMLIAMRTLKDVGLMNSKLFIDYVDFDWCWRAAKKGYECCMTSNIKMLHRVGEEDKSFLSYAVLVSKPIRYYYQYRNFILLLRMSYVPLNWKLKGLIKKIFFLFYLPLSCKRGSRIFINMIKGIRNGILNY